jgi:hypothetical protein
MLELLAVPSRSTATFKPKAEGADPSADGCITAAVRIFTFHPLARRLAYAAALFAAAFLIAGGAH